ncbi:NUDIX domain-containing protein [Amycolatopsis saalfeldensis]|uniref:NUDIX domain-containing protein n=1 Tax=Amycolatopsis saalfeldensis TaxID=394193 RepID=A0A1H8YQX0_9PSEU|nr:NUDIX hydrolase [Amycolatopsis saalfeldensis]SEP54566.1 NUDIX domain-containing protein [Amycolatopsis saalfeldensis]
MSTTKITTASGTTMMELATGIPVHHATNAVVIAPDASGTMCALLAERDREPHAGQWGLPGGVCQPGEAPSVVAVRRAREKTGIDLDGIELVHASSRDEGRDEAGRYVTVSYVVMLDRPVPLQVGDMIRQARWWPIAEALRLELAYDHAKIIRDALAAAGLTIS